MSGMRPRDRRPDGTDRLDPELDRDLRALFGGAARPAPPASLDALLDELPARRRSSWGRLARWRPRDWRVVVRRATATAAVVLVVAGVVTALPSLRLGMAGSAAAPSAAAASEIAGGPTAAASQAPAASQTAAASVAPSPAATEAASASAAATSAASQAAASASASTSSGSVSPGDALAIARQFVGRPSWSPLVDSSGLASGDPVYVVSGDRIVVRVAALTGRVRGYTDGARMPAGGGTPVPVATARAAATTFLAERGVEVVDLPSVASSTDAATGAFTFAWRGADSPALVPMVTVYVNPSTGEVFEFTDLRP